MDVRDLMIGDYVMINEDNSIDRITGLTYYNSISFEHTDDHYDEEVSPIELTNEILDLNEFILDEISGNWTKGTLMISGREAPYFISGIEISYVHELQNVANMLGHRLESIKFPKNFFKLKCDDIVLVRDYSDENWKIRRYCGKCGSDYLATDLEGFDISSRRYSYCIPYNEKTFKLLDTSDNYDKD